MRRAKAEPEASWVQETPAAAGASARLQMMSSSLTTFTYCSASSEQPSPAASRRSHSAIVLPSSRREVRPGQSSWLRHGVRRRPALSWPTRPRTPAD